MCVYSYVHDIYATEPKQILIHVQFLNDIRTAITIFEVTANLF